MSEGGRECLQSDAHLVPSMSVRAPQECLPPLKERKACRSPEKPLGLITSVLVLLAGSIIVSLTVSARKLQDGFKLVRLDVELMINYH